MPALTLLRWILRVAIGVVLVVELVIGLGVLLQALSANPDASFTEWAYRNQDRLMRPFEDMFDDASIGDGDAVVDLSGLFAMAAYGALFVPLGIALGRVRRTQDRIVQQRREEKTEWVREARLYGKHPIERPEEPPTGWWARLRGAFGRRGERSGAEPNTSSADPEP